jgi:UV DNA damage endonuclease
MPHEVGYCCINVTLGKEKITTGRTMRKATFQEDKNLVYTSSLALANAQDLVKIIEWNIQNNIKVFRIGSNIFPWNSEYHVSDLPDIDKINQCLHTAGMLAIAANMRLSFHPDHFVKLGTTKDEVARRSIHDLNHHDDVMTAMGLPVSHYYPLNIHVGMNRAPDVTDRFCERFHMLNPTTQQRLVVENDDKANAYSVQQLYDDVYLKIDTPITFDYFHHTFHPDGLSSKEAATLAASTWDCTPLFHYSESKNFNENVQGNPRAHSDYVFNLIDDYELNIDIDIEAKAKEFSLMRYREMQYDMV